jgi:hypothetical protein
MHLYETYDFSLDNFKSFCFRCSIKLFLAIVIKITSLLGLSASVDGGLSGGSSMLRARSDGPSSALAEIICCCGLPYTFLHAGNTNCFLSAQKTLQTTPQIKVI